MRRRAVVLAAALLLAGCTTAPPPPPDPRPEWNGIPITHPHALLSCPALLPVHLDALPDADVAEVRRCIADFHEVEGVLNKVQYVQRLTSDSDTVLDAYAAPDEPASDGPCGQPLLDPGVLWLEFDSGDVVAVRAPVDACGLPLRVASDAYDAAQFETILVAREVASTLDD
jgi:hypothetical protein